MGFSEAVAEMGKGESLVTSLPRWRENHWAEINLLFRDLKSLSHESIK